MLPENGYESPRLPDNEEPFFGNGMGNGAHKVAERRRAGRSGQTSLGSGTPDDRDNDGGNVGGSDTDLRGEESREAKKVGIRDRVGCFTWTWFTMTMASGGIANVLHSSMIDRKNDVELVLTSCSSLSI